MVSRLRTDMRPQALWPLHVMTVVERRSSSKRCEAGLMPRWQAAGALRSEDDGLERKRPPGGAE